MPLPAIIESESQLEDVLTQPSPTLVQVMSALQGDLSILGVGGKMGPTLARLARRALDEAGSRSDVIGVARFSDPKVRDLLESRGVRTLQADLLADDAMKQLPDAANVIFLAARKFGSTGDESTTWAMNTLLPARVADRYRDSRIVALSTGNVYPLSPIESHGPTEDDLTGPIGEYAQSCRGKERMFEYFSRQCATRTAIVRLNYAIDLRYGVLIDIARRVWTNEPIDLTMGHVNIVWQGDANTAVLRCFEHCASPPFVLNLTSPETYSVRQLATALGKRLDKQPVFQGTEAPNALLSNAARYKELMGGPTVTVDRMIDWVAEWIRRDGVTWGKPTHFQVRDGKF